MGLGHAGSCPCGAVSSIFTTCPGFDCVSGLDEICYTAPKLISSLLKDLAERPVPKACHAKHHVQAGAPFCRHPGCDHLGTTLADMLIGLRGLLFCLLLFTPSSASTAPDIIEDDSEQVYHMVARVGQSNARRQDDAVRKARFDCDTGRSMHTLLLVSVLTDLLHQAFNDMNGDITNNCRNAPTYKISKGTLSSTLNNV